MSSVYIKSDVKLKLSEVWDRSSEYDGMDYCIDGGIRFLQNDDTFLPHYIESTPQDCNIDKTFKLCEHFGLAEWLLQ